jgi:hypothetical protein
MPRYQLTVLKDIGRELLNDVTIMDPFPIEVRERMSSNKDLTITQISIINITLTEEEFLFLKLKYSMIDSKVFTAVDVVGAIINA